MAKDEVVKAEAGGGEEEGGKMFSVSYVVRNSMPTCISLTVEL